MTITLPLVSLLALVFELVVLAVLGSVAWTVLIYLVGRRRRGRDVPASRTGQGGSNGGTPPSGR